MNTSSINPLAPQPQRLSKKRKKSTARLEGAEPPHLDEARILDWADAFYASRGRWPRWDSGPIRRSDGETWFGVSTALVLGQRGFPPGGSLEDFLARHERLRRDSEEWKRSPGEILACAKAWHKRTGHWPNSRSGEIPGQAGLTWLDVSRLLQSGQAGLPIGTTLLVLRRSKRPPAQGAPLTEQQILEWIDAHRARTGQWPVPTSGRILDTPGETWMSVSLALLRGSRGLRTRSSICELLRKYRGIQKAHDGPVLSIPLLVDWASSFRARAGRWPRRTDGPIPESPGETWMSVDRALQGGHRGLPRLKSLACLRKTYLTDVLNERLPHTRTTSRPSAMPSELDHESTSAPNGQRR
jgi:hypothetical protein